MVKQYLRNPYYIENVVIHKDGPFFHSEIRAIERLFPNKKVYPISIIRNEVPRVFNIDYKGDGIGLTAVTFLALTENDYILITTPVRNWKPARQGCLAPFLSALMAKPQATTLKLK